MNTDLKLKIDETLKDIKSIPSMPSIVNRLIALAYDPEVDIKALAEEISKDPAITAGIIKLANSAYFRSSGKIRSVHEAIVNLGLNEVKDIVIILATKDILKKPMDAYKMDEKALWEHCLLVGELASSIAKKKKTKTLPDIAFTAGLLHDIGKVVLIEFFSKIYRQLTMDMQKNPEARFSDLEKKYLGYNHSELGGKLLEIWNFPEDLVESVTCVYHPENAKINPELVSIIHIANIIALSSGVGIDIGGMAESLSEFAIKTLAIKEEELLDYYQEVPEYIKQLEELGI